MEIGKKIKFLRQQNNLTQEELGDRCELSKGFISQLENDMTSPSITTLTYILDALGTNLSEFFSEEQEEQVVYGTEDYAVKVDDELKNEINRAARVKMASIMALNMPQLIVSGVDEKPVITRGNLLSGYTEKDMIYHTIENRALLNIKQSGVLFN